MNDTPKRPRLTRDAVLAGAVSLADEIGVEPLTIRKLADHLGVKPMTIYHHVANKDEIIDGMVDAVFAEIEMPPADTPWREAMSARAHSARSALRRHPWAAGMLDSRTNPGPANLAHHDAVIACLRMNGFSVAMTAHAYATLDAFIYGFALQEAALPGMTGDELVETAEHMLAEFAKHYPHLAEFTAAHVLQPGYDFGDEFEFGLELILDGLERAVREV
jgi:AcrR family transcriptional regulator